jgi:hypothetical protein
MAKSPERQEVSLELIPGPVERPGPTEVLPVPKQS